MFHKLSKRIFIENLCMCNLCKGKSSKHMSVKTHRTNGLHDLVHHSHDPSFVEIFHMYRCGKILLMKRRIASINVYYCINGCNTIRKCLAVFLSLTSS